MHKVELTVVPKLSDQGAHIELHADREGDEEGGATLTVHNTEDGTIAVIGLTRADVNELVDTLYRLRRTVFY